MTAYEQRITALENANKVRIGRAKVKRLVREGVLPVREAMDLECVQGMRVFDLIQAQRYWGSSQKYRGHKATRLLSSLQISPYRTVGELNRRQRSLIGERCP